MGNVDVGDTAMDFLPAERERGITITAAAICFSWRNHEIFLVDSPGHLDFTFEVERALRVMDGVVVLLDAVAGVQPQTETVWRQADTNGLPRLIFINKMDREGADFEHTMTAIRHFFNVTPVITHIPIFDDSGTFVGIYNVLERFRSSASPPTYAFVGKSSNREDFELSYEDLSEKQMSRVDSAAELLVETCADINDDIMDAWVAGNPVGRDLIQNAIREACIRRSLVPVLCGSSLKEIGVQSLLDSILSFLPSPLERAPFEASTVADGTDTHILASDHENAPFLAYAFKVIHDKHRGRMVLLRALSGRLETRPPFLNTTTGKKEQPTRLLRILADKYEEVESVETGDIFAAVRLFASSPLHVIGPTKWQIRRVTDHKRLVSNLLLRSSQVGLRSTTTGDTLMRFGAPKDAQVVLSGVQSPPAVFAVALEVDSPAQEKELSIALQRLVDEDSSLQLMQDSDTGETLLAGMGELHLEVSIDHMQRKLPFGVHKSHPRVSYRETVTQAVTHDEVLDTAIGSTRFVEQLSISLQPSSKNNYENIVMVDEETFNFDEREAIQQGVAAALGRGPIIGANVTGIEVRISAMDADTRSRDEAGLRACASKGVTSALLKGEAVVMEPVMRVEALVPEEFVGDVVSELTHPTRRRGTIEAMSAHNNNGDLNSGSMHLVIASVPVEGMIGWATKMRSITKGRGTLQATFAEYRSVDRSTQARIVENL